MTAQSPMGLFLILVLGTWQRPECGEGQAARWTLLQEVGSSYFQASNQGRSRHLWYVTWSQRLLPAPLATALAVGNSFSCLVSSPARLASLWRAVATFDRRVLSARANVVGGREQSG